MPARGVPKTTWSKRPGGIKQGSYGCKGDPMFMKIMLEGGQQVEALGDHHPAVGTLKKNLRLWSDHEVEMLERRKKQKIMMK